MIKDSGARTEFSTGAKRDIQHGKGRMDLLPWYGIMEVSKHCEEGADKYGEHNVDKGIPLHSLCDSAARHLAKFIAGETDEDHLRAAAWNLLWALNQRTTHPELNDMYWAKKDIPECKEVIVVPEELVDFCEDRILDISEICKPGFSDKVFKLLSNRNDIQSGLYKILDFSVETSYYTAGKKCKLRLTQCDGCFTDPRTIELENLDDIELFRFDLKKPLSFMDIVSLNLGLVYVESDSKNIKNGVYTVTVCRGNPNDHINPFCNTSVELTKLRTDKHPKDSPNITFGYYKPNKGLNVYCLEGSDAYDRH